MDDDYRKAEGQLDLFPEEQKKQNRFFYTIAGFVATLALILLFLPSAFAQESFSLYLEKAMLCDTEEQAKDQVDIFSSSDEKQIAPTVIEGCGFLAYPAPAILTPLDVYENKYLTVQLARIEVMGLPTQYGYLSYEKKVADKGV